jgi:hypothetical protein
MEDFTFTVSNSGHTHVSWFAEEIQLYHKYGIRQMQLQIFASTHKEVYVNYKDCTYTMDIFNP